MDEDSKTEDNDDVKPNHDTDGAADDEAVADAESLPDNAGTAHYSATLKPVVKHFDSI